MSYYDKIVNDDISTLEYKKTKYISYESSLNNCVNKLKNYESTISGCKVVLGDFLINEMIFADKKIAALSSNVATLRSYLKDTIIPIVNQNVDIIGQRIAELSTAASAEEPYVPPAPSVSPPPNKGGDGPRTEWAP